MADLYLTHEGDLSISSDGGLNAVAGMLESMQTIGLIMKTKLGTFEARPTIGNRLDELIGELMTQTVLKKAEKLIYRSLTGYINFINKSIEVRCSPVNSTQALFVIFIENGINDKIYSIPFDFQHGIIEQRADIYANNSGLLTILEAPAIGSDPTEEI